ncbi:MAG: polysaccharide biosynthesis tyrosine autokinase [Desulfobulbaceae bacterium]
MIQPHLEPPGEEQGLNLRDYLRILNKRRFTVITIFIIVYIFFIILGLSKETPLYTSTSTILLERNIGASNTGLGTNFYWDPEFLPTQTEIIRSKKVARRVVEELELDTKQRGHFLGGQTIVESPLKTAAKSFIRFFTAFFSASQLDEKEPARISPPPDPEFDKNLIADIIKARISVQPVKDTRVVNISYTDTDPRIAKMITDALIQAYIEETLDIKLSGTKQSLKWMTNKAEQERKKLEQAEKNLQRYLRENNLVTLENRLAIYPEKLSQFSTELSQAESRRKELEDLLKQIAAAGNDPKILESIPAFANNSNLQSLRDRILQAEQRIKELSKKYGPKHPAMIKAVDERDILLKEKEQEIRRISDSLHKELELARSNEENLRELLTSTKNELLDVNERFIQYSIMKREVDSSRALYEALTSSLKKASVTEESQNVNIWVMREASLPRGPSNQKPKRTMLVGFIVALAAGIGTALLVEYLDNTVKTPDDIENRFGLTVLGAIFETKKTSSIESIVLENGQSPISESYRMVRSSLLLSSADHPPRTILVSSMKPQAGKTTTALNLARTMAQVSGKVLVIDADMRRPRIHKILGVKNDIGLSSFLSGSIDELILQAQPGEDILVKKPEGEMIHLIPSGPIPPNPVELISSERMKDLLSEMKLRYDYVFIDSPPIINLADALILSTLAEGTIIVARAGKTTYDAFNAGLKKLTEIQPRILGVVLNGVSTRSIDRHSYYDYYEYYARDQGDAQGHDAGRSRS